MARLPGFLLATLLFSGCLGGCVSTPEGRRDTVRKRSAREWHCPSEDVKVRYLGGKVYEATGCMRRATYVCDEDYVATGLGPGAGVMASGDVRCVRESFEDNSRPAPPPPKPTTMPGWQQTR